MPRRRKEYFPYQPGEPEPLAALTCRRVRFEEVDPIHFVWHGRYPSYLEDGRVAFGEKYRLGYSEFIREKFMAPIVAMHIDYHHPLVLLDEFEIHTLLHWTEAARLNFSYKIINSKTKELAVTAYTIQLLMDEQRELMLVPPEYFYQFLQKWKNKKFR